MLRLTIALLMVFGLAACETTKGFVRDSQNVGNALT